MLCSFLRRVVEVGHPQFIRVEVCKVFRFKALASFYSGSLFLWARCCCSYPRGNISSFGGDISKTSECKKEKNRFSREGSASPYQGSEIGGTFKSPRLKARAGVVAPSFPCLRAGARFAPVGAGARFAPVG